MPTAAQRQRQQRAAAAAALAGQAGIVAAAANPTSTAQPHVKRTQTAPSTSKSALLLGKAGAKGRDTDADAQSDNGAAFSDDDSDDNDVAAFEMDGQDVWTQNYCATCDCLIEPGQGVNARPAADRRQSQQSASAVATTAAAQTPTTSEPNSAATTVVQSPVEERPRSSAGLKSKNGTIKARPPSSDGTSSATSSGTSKFKRTNSAGRLHAVGGGTGFGQGKRTGSAGSRLNALSELRPTTKLNAAAPSANTANAKAKAANDKTSGTRKSAALSRQNSTASNKSSTPSAHHGSSGPSSPASANATLPRTKKGGLLGALTPAALQQQEELENAKVRAPGAMYCSERCREIDEQKSQGLGELVYYMQQPTSPTAYWANGAIAGPSSYGARSNRASTGSLSSRPTSTRVYYPRGYTPESECMCQDCLEKNSIGGTVPSGASDTAESSVSFNYGPGAYDKRRTQSGRLITPQNLHSPAHTGHGSGDYFGPQAAILARQERNAQSTLPRGQQLGDASSQAGTESSTRSDESEMWEPRYGQHGASRQERANNSAKEPRTRDSTYSRSSQARGSATTGTITPARARDSSIHSEGQTSLDGRQASHADIQAVLEAEDKSSTSAASPMRLLRRGDHHTAASVDVTPDHATSPQPSSSFLSRSVASERTEDGASSGVTLAPHMNAPSSSFLERRVLRRATSRTSMSGITAQGAGRLGGERFTDSPAPHDTTGALPTQASSALGSLMSATNQGRAISPALGAGSKGDAEPRRPSLAPSHASTNSSNSSSGWLRSSISSAWNSLRGLPSSDGLAAQGAVSRGSVPSLQVSDIERGEVQVVPMPTQGGASPSDGPTPLQTLVHRPTIKRGKVPSFAHEIGRGEIPGGEHDRQSVHSESSNPPDSAGLPKSMANLQDAALQEERLRRRQERERAARHQRSKDVTQLPPLLGVAQRSGSSVNIHGMRGGRTMSTTSLASTGSYDASAVYGLRPTTPNLNRRAAHGGSGTSLHDLGTSPGRPSNMAAFGTSPRRAGLGWGAMTPLAQLAPTEAHAPRNPYHHHQHVVHRPGHHQQHHSMHAHQSHGAMTRNAAIQAGHQAKHRSHGGVPVHNVSVGHLGMLGMHPHGHGPIYGRHATTPVRMSTPSVPEHGGEMSSAALKGEASDEGETSDEEEEAARQRKQNGSTSGVQALSRSFGKRINLDPMPPPQRPRSGMSMRAMTPVGDYAPPLRPLSRTQVAKHERAGSHDLGQHASATKLYPVLDVPNREPTHDRYGLGWGIAEAGGIEDLLPRRTSGSSQKPFGGIERGIVGGNKDRVYEESPDRQASNAPSTSSSINTTAEDAARQHRAAAAAAHARKKLFYFDNS